MKIRNPTSSTVRVPSLQLTWEPGEIHEVDACYCTPRRAKNGQKIHAVLESLAPQLIPADDDEHEQYFGSPKIFKAAPSEEVPKPPPPDAAALEAEGLSPGVAAILAEQALTEGELPAKRAALPPLKGKK
jgi:hypothetical protein